MSRGATTLWEYWDWTQHGDSKNHHMYSDFMGWIIKTILGIQTERYNKIHINPYIFSDLDYARGYVKTEYGKLSVNWKKKFDCAIVEVFVQGNLEVYYTDEKLKPGKNIIEKQNVLKVSKKDMPLHRLEVN